jgi:integrin alpha FG-GAP repeat containing protein 1
MSAASVWSWNRRKQSCVAVQLPQGGYAPLQPPFVLVGLGLTNDYVERLMVGMPSGRVRRFDQAVLPNSRLTVTPTPLDAPAAWEMELYLAPMQQLAVALVCTALLLLLGTIIAVLEVVERVHDFRENKALRPALPL